ncbi:MAG: tRNA (guanosine(46)-N7)-methyltransferase TrmB [Bacilli bacterium]|nr:tRNA (guanosine(46)-N7)-methyltransferase TrmB [Bacilli bacterium]MDD3895879.1 tRNA (guanosine(46)-N7)-methyltransferase TrmB [Bacilli bacterium]MDD4407759.1 tRNA (guanosine(46)-N7)-methyltransferase TrmB [Bacilli bacterium]
MRLRKIKNAKEIIINHPLVIKELNSETFLNNNPISIEIGTGKGDFIIEMAKKYPHINFIGIEKYDSVLVRALEKLDEIIPNLRFICNDARFINDYIKIKVNNLYLNFSDPWPKKRHEKRRLTSKDFLDQYEKIFDQEINIYLKTDNKGLFAYSILSLSNNNYIFKDLSLDLHQEKISNVLTEYEKKFSLLGLTINYLHAFKKI